MEPDNKFVIENVCPTNTQSIMDPCKLHRFGTFLFKPPKISKGPLKYQICPFLQYQVDIYWTGSEDNYRTGSEDNYRMLKLPYLQHPVDINRKS